MNIEYLVSLPILSLKSLELGWGGGGVACDVTHLILSSSAIWAALEMDTVWCIPESIGRDIFREMTWLDMFPSQA